VVFSSGVPMIVQKFISGPSIRTFVIEERAYSARIESPLPDYRIDSSVVVSRISTPEAISGQAIAIMNCLGLRWTAIDWIQGHDGVYYFLEANFSPMFSAFSEMTGYPVADYLSRALLRSR
jgi:glutathione synthase/RimK-type ligase-like ATP-grasp enzyme